MAEAPASQPRRRKFQSEDKMWALRFAALGVAALLLGAPNDVWAQEYEEIGKLVCKPEKKWRWWVLVFSRAYSKCDFERLDGEHEAYEGRSGVEFGVDLMSKPFEFNVSVTQKPPIGELEAYELAGKKFKSTMWLRGDENEALISGRFKLEPVLTEGIAGGIIYLKLDRPERDGP